MNFGKNYMSRSNNNSTQKKKIFHFDTCEVGDYVKFRLLKSSTQPYYEDDSTFLLPELKEVESDIAVPSYSDIVSGKSSITQSSNFHPKKQENFVEPLTLFKADSIWNPTYSNTDDSQSNWDLLGTSNPFSLFSSSSNTINTTIATTNKKEKGKGEGNEEQKEETYTKRRNYTIYYGKVVEVEDENISVIVNEKKKSDNTEFPPGIPIQIDRRCIIQLFNQKLVSNISPRLALKNLWRNLIFREVKITKQHLLKHVDYKYLNKYGLERHNRFLTMEEAHLKINPQYHKNLHPCYAEYYGFTKNKFIRSNDTYDDKEIFFSKKCYCELDFSDNPTADFILDERGFNHVPPSTDTLICGIVENGEKGLFFRKWFVCSSEFLTLWTMVCEPQHPSLKDSKYVILPREGSNSVDKKLEKPKIKDFDVLVNDLDTSKYSVNMNTFSSKEIKEIKEKKDEKEVRGGTYTTYNLERPAIYYTDRYQQVALAVFHSSNKTPHSFSSSMSTEFPEYTDFQKKLIQNLLWVKRVKV